MIKYKASQVIERAKSLADIQNTNFITWGDCWQMLNSAYRKVYQDMINAGDLNYIKEVGLITGNTTSLYELPDDFYQLAMITDDNGNEIPLLSLASANGDWGYRIQNNNILLQNVRGNVVMKYYPIPETLTYKKERTGGYSLVASNIVSGFDTKVYLSTGYVYDFATQTNISGFPQSSYVMMGKDALLVLPSEGSITGTVYWLNSKSSADSITYPMLTTSGSFKTGPAEGAFGWCNDDATARFTVSKRAYGWNVLFNGEQIGTISSEELNFSFRCIYWNGKWALVTLKKIFYEDGTWETTDSPQAIALLKCDTTTGYGYVIQTGSNLACLEGWTPDTLIDYPSNILFDLTAYDLAIQFRIKQNSDATQLKTVYNQLEETYWKSLPRDNDNFVTIRNVNKNYTRWSWY